MLLEGSCHCGAVRFSVTSHTPVPFMLCYCSICRKTAGGGGFAINIMARADTLHVEGAEHLAVYQARLSGPQHEPGEVSPGRRHFCNRCGSALWLADPRWPEWVYPFASAIDSPLPVPPERVHMMEHYKVAWSPAAQGPHDAHFPEYPQEAISDWHKRRGLYQED